MLPDCRLILDSEAREGAWNMAIDEALLESAVVGGPAVLRWYQWLRPTLSLGYFQSAAEVEQDPRWTSVAKVRRLTGGGAILHDQEWTYSLVLPADQRYVRHPYDLYDRVHEAIIHWFQEHARITIAMRGSTHREAEEPALCFLRQDSHDLCLAGQKVLGSAQRRRRGALLQHGSLILSHSEWAPEVAGLIDLTGRGDLLDKRDELAWGVAGQLAQQIDRGDLTTDELAAATRLVEGYRRLHDRDARQ